MKLKILLLLFVFFLYIVSCLSQYWMPLSTDCTPNYPVNEVFSNINSDTLYLGGIFKYINCDEDSILVNSIAGWSPQSGYFSLENGYDNCFNVCLSPDFITKFQNKILFSHVGPTFNGLPVFGIASWDGLNWDTLGAGIKGKSGNSGRPLCSLNTEDQLIIGGIFHYAGEHEVNSLASWNGNEWKPVFFPSANDFDPWIIAITDFNSERYFAGNFHVITTDGSETKSIVKNNETGWEAVFNGVNGSNGIVQDMLVYNSELYIGGHFLAVEGNAANKLMKLGSNGWESVGGSFSNPLDQVLDLHVHNGFLYVAGLFHSVGNGVQAHNLARWDGERWCSLGIDGQGKILSMTSYKEDLVIAGVFFLPGKNEPDFVARWTGGNEAFYCGEPITGVETRSDKEKFKIFPNPARDQLHIQYSAPGSPADIRIHDLAGRELYARQLPPSTQLETLDIDVGHWPPGVYLVSVVSGGKQAVRRVAVY